jgi:protein-tyrosine-phosphatase
MDATLNILTLCTGNVARSVMLGYMLTTLGEANGVDWAVRTAGTHVVEGSAMSARTRTALERLEDLGPHHYGAHRSRQVGAHDLAWADVVLASEAAHVAFVRCAHAEHAGKSVQLGQFVRYAPLDAPVARQVAAVAALEPDRSFDVLDPAGGDQLAYDVCARDLWDLAQAFAVLVLD